MVNWSNNPPRPAHKKSTNLSYDPNSVKDIHQTLLNISLRLEAERYVLQSNDLTHYARELTIINAQLKDFTNNLNNQLIKWRKK